jgi:hypothetical protein
MLLTRKQQHIHLTSGEKALVKVSEVTATDGRNAVIQLLHGQQGHRPYLFDPAVVLLQQSLRFP